MSLPPSAAKKRSIAFSVALYRLLLVAYPASFRRRYGEPMVQAFRDTCRQAEESRGLAGVLVLWLPTLADLIKTACAERLASIGPISRLQIMRWCGVLTLLGAAFGLLNMLLLIVGFSQFWGGSAVCCQMLVSFVPSGQFVWEGQMSFQPGNGSSHVVWAASFMSLQPINGSPLELFAMLCLTFGVIGVLLIQQRRVGKLSGGLALLGQLLLVGHVLNAALFLSWPVFWLSLVPSHSSFQWIDQAFYYGTYFLLPATLFLWGLISLGAGAPRSISLLLLLLGLNSILISFLYLNLYSWAFWLAMMVTWYLLWGALGYALWRGKAQPSVPQHPLLVALGEMP